MCINAIDLITSIVPYGGTADVLISTWREKRIKEAQSIYLMEVRDGIFDNINTDDTIGIAHRLWRAISEGTAKNNFRLICRLVQGLGNNKQLSAPNFLRFANVLDSLSDEEIKVIALDIWEDRNPAPKEPKKYEYNYQYNKEDLQKHENDLKQYKLEKQKWEDIISKLKQSYGFSSNHIIDEIHYSLLRTGLYGLNVVVDKPEVVVTHEQGFSDYGDYDEYITETSEQESNPYFYFTNLMNELIKYVDFAKNTINLYKDLRVLITGGYCNYKDLNDIQRHVEEFHYTLKEVKIIK